jgi:hypothetical protein
MARSLRDIQRKMKAIKSTRQVTKAMELVAASKMRRAVQHAQSLRQYALHAWDIINRYDNGNQGFIFKILDIFLDLANIFGGELNFFQIFLIITGRLLCYLTGLE